MWAHRPNRRKSYPWRTFRDAVSCSALLSGGPRRERQSWARVQVFAQHNTARPAVPTSRWSGFFMTAVQTFVDGSQTAARDSVHTAWLCQTR